MVALVVRLCAGGSPLTPNMAYRFACDGLVQLVRDAANPDHPRVQPYRTDIVGEAVWMARFVMRKAVAHGWYRCPEEERRLLIVLDVDPALELVE
jgi:hypothetical protein